MPDPTDTLNAALEGRYRIERELGEGGMATVYLAADLRHERKVALKVLKPELAAVVGAERFLAEIKTTANLQHPHILPLFDSGEADGFLFYVMPYVEGETLRERVDREKQLPVDEAVELATHMIEALDYAHRRGVIHRDIKPANVLLQEGKPVISDFGIALAVGAAGGGRLTETGLSLGTPHYMSPEQATGEANVGPAADIYAVGCVLYEMLVGHPPHVGSTPQAILGKIITEPPASVSRERKTVPPNVDAAVAKALEKVPADRFASAGQMKDALRDPGFRTRSAYAGHAAGAGSPRTRGLVGALVGALIVMTGVAAWGWSRSSVSEEPYRVVSLDLSGLTDPEAAALPPTGDQVAVIAENRLWVRGLDQFSFRALPGTEGASNPAWSPDGEWVVFAVRDEVRKIHRSGEPMSLVMRLPNPCPKLGVCGFSWTDDGRIVAASGFEDVYVAPEEGGAAEVLIAHGDDEHFHRPTALPGGAVLVVVDYDARETAVELWDGSGRTPVPDMGGFIVVAGDIVFYQRDEEVWARRYSPSDRDFVGAPMFVASGMRLLGAAQDGTILGGPLESSDFRARELTWVDRDGNDIESVADLRPGEGVIGAPRMSGDGLVAYIDDGEIWIFDPARGAHRPGPERLGTQGVPTWSPDGRRLYYNETTEGEEWFEGAVRVFDPVTRDASVAADVGSSPTVSFDGRFLLYRVGREGQGRLLYRDLRDPSSEPTPFTHGFAGEGSPALSPTSDLVAFFGRERSGGLGTLWASRFPSGDDLSLVATDLDTDWAVWSADGRNLYFSQHGSLMEVRVASGPEGITLSEPLELFGLQTQGIDMRNLSVPGDGSRFLVGGRFDLVGLRSSLILIQNWRPER